MGCEMKVCWLYNSILAKSISIGKPQAKGMLIVYIVQLDIGNEVFGCKGTIAYPKIYKQDEQKSILSGSL